MRKLLLEVFKEVFAVNFGMAILFNEPKKVSLWHYGYAPSKSGNWLVSCQILSLTRSLLLSCLFCLSFELEAGFDFFDESPVDFSI